MLIRNSRRCKPHQKGARASSVELYLNQQKSQCKGAGSAVPAVVLHLLEISTPGFATSMLEHAWSEFATFKRTSDRAHTGDCLGSNNSKSTHSNLRLSMLKAWCSRRILFKPLRSLANQDVVVIEFRAELNVKK